MNALDLVPVPESEFPTKDRGELYKIYHDGGHYVATKVRRCTDKSLKYRKGYPRNDIDILFDSLFLQATKDGLKDTKLETPFSDYIRVGILELFPNFVGIDDYVARKIKRKWHNLGVRKKRFMRKAHLNKWNYYITLTYDDIKQTAESFEQRLCKCFSNLATRYKWRIMGKFEHAPETGRLHFHGVAYIPYGCMVGTITEKQDYSTAQGKMQTRHENDFFQKAFGRNDFTELNEMQLKYGHTLDYIIKYISKDNGRVFCSRGIPATVVKKLTDDSVITKYTDFVTKYVLFDSVVDWEKDIQRLRNRKQVSLIDIICNPPLTA